MYNFLFIYYLLSQCQLLTKQSSWSQGEIYKEALETSLEFALSALKMAGEKGQIFLILKM